VRETQRADFLMMSIAKIANRGS